MREQEPKYEFRDGSVFNRASGEMIPSDEPVMVFRARDRWAREVIRRYLELVGGDVGVPSSHVEIVHERLEDFEYFAERHPERMKAPDTERVA